jgi:hypothetical protein
VFSFQYPEPGARRAGEGGAISTQCPVLSKPTPNHQFAICNLQFAICNPRASARSTGFSRNPAPPKGGTTSARRGLTLIEVLASIGVLTIGLLSLAALLPVGQVTLFEAIKADRAGTCGRAAMRDVIVRRMLDYHNWCDANGVLASQANFLGGSNWSKAWFDQYGNLKYNQNGVPNMPPSFIIDPLGVTSGSLNSTLGNNLTVSGTQVSWLTNVPRITLATTNAAGQTLQYSASTAAAVFRAADDLVVPLPENMTPPQPQGRPLPQWDTSVSPSALQSQGDYTWFLSVSPESTANPNNLLQYTVTNPARFTVSVVVCYRRVFNPAGEQAVPVKTYLDTVVEGNITNVAQAGGSVQLNQQIGGANNVNVRENDWVALCNNSGICRWYRIAAIGDDTSYLTLSGPDWPYYVLSSGLYGDEVVALGQDVVGVYTTTVDLDTDATWKN